MKAIKLLLKAAVGLLILIPLSLNSCEIEEDSEWCVSCRTSNPLSCIGLHECFDSEQEAEDYIEYVVQKYRDACDIISCEINDVLYYHVGYDVRP